MTTFTINPEEQDLDVSETVKVIEDYIRRELEAQSAGLNAEAQQLLRDGVPPQCMALCVIGGSDAWPWIEIYPREPQDA